MRRITAAVAAVGLMAVAAGCGSTAGGSEGGGDYPQGRVSIMAPADPGGGWDETARAFQQSIREEKLADGGTQVYNVSGAGGTLGLSPLASKNAEAQAALIETFPCAAWAGTAQPRLEVGDGAMCTREHAALAATWS